MSKPWNPGKKTVELRPSRIRRDPVSIERPAGAHRKPQWDPTEWETWVVVCGVVLFALALSALCVGLSEITSR
jgi:hypothetical protein